MLDIIEFFLSFTIPISFGYKLDSLVSHWLMPLSDFVESQTHNTEDDHDGPDHRKHNCVVRQTLIHYKRKQIQQNR